MTHSPRLLRRLVLPGLLLAGLAVLVAGPRVLAQDGEQATPAGGGGGGGGGVGVVDVNGVITGSDIGQALQAQGEARRTQIQGELTNLRTQLEGQQAALAELQPGSEQFEETQARARQIAVRAQVLQQLGQDELARFNRDNLIDVYGQLEEAIRQVARERGLDVVIRKAQGDLPDDLRTLNPQQLNQALAGQTTLYVSAGSDITTEVIAAMNRMNQEAQGE
jgi:Skp family chaperone for outer membrane proteins